MIQLDRVLLSDDVKENFFVCDLEKCKGACCVEGDLGAPLEPDELPVLSEIYDKVAPYLSEEGRNAIKEQGLYVLDEDKEYSTPTIEGKECAYAVYDDNGTLKCGIERAYLDGKTAFKKPISCHLYPLRISHYGSFDAVNYDRWEICHAACILGDKLGVPVYKFLKEALTRKYGEEWYTKLVAEIRKGE